LVQLALFAIVMLTDWNIVAIVTALGVPVSSIGSQVAGRVDERKLRRVFGVFLIVMGIYVMARTLPSVWPF